MDSLIDSIPVSAIYSVIYVLITLLVTIVINSLLSSFIRVPTRLDNRRGKTYISIIKSIVTVILFGIALHIIFNILNINVIPLLASAGIVGLALGIGARPLIEDLIAGFFLLTGADIGIGDHIKTNTDIEGRIEDIGFRTLTIRGFDGSLNLIRNGQLNQITNLSRRKAILQVDVPVKASGDVEKALEILNEELELMRKDKKLEYEIDDESKVIGILSLQIPDCALIRVNIVTSASGRGKIDAKYRLKVTQSFKKHKISLS